ncbi:MAG: hypothetical protein WEB57_04470 [Pseudohongiellaceae bacterium]
MKLDQILLDPAAAYDNPLQVVEDASLEQADKIHVLHRWEYDARQLAVAESEGMGKGNATVVLDQVLQALEALGAEPGVE